jgi:hypothetical protein
VLPTTLPGWTLPRGSEPDEIAATFAAGIALKSLDDLVRSAPVWAGCWRARQALKCAAVAVRLMGRNEDEAALRDPVLLTAVGDDPGPAGRVLLAFKRLPPENPPFPRRRWRSLPICSDWHGTIGSPRSSTTPTMRCNPAARRRLPRRIWRAPSTPRARMPSRWPGRLLTC